MSYLTHLKRSSHCDTCRWIVKFNSKELIREVKLVYNPDEYSKLNAKRYGHKARKLHNRDQLIQVMEADKVKRNA
jgi:hypothetical protein